MFKWYGVKKCIKDDTYMSSMDCIYERYQVQPLATSGFLKNSVRQRFFGLDPEDLWMAEVDGLKNLT